ncbi:MAG: aminoacyl-tRNA hydrolase [Simkaniaceae bacterium]|nr:aminoacyl-tRNA hydrolase [Candidatus Sacchlamyda saccharinae]
MREERFLICGLGNPGAKYEDTRHNIGFRIVKALAAKYSISTRPALIRAKGSLGKGIIREKTTHLLMPLTYMNESGLSVRKCMSYYKIPPSHLLVVTDDVALDFGVLRLRMKGSCGGHNGLRSIEKHLGTSEYNRLRFGVGDKEQGDLADYVLGRFSRDEQVELPKLVDQATQGIETFLEMGIESAMNKMNTVGEKKDA